MKSIFLKTAELLLIAIVSVLCLSSCELIEDLKNDVADGIVSDIESGAAQDKFNDLFDKYLVDYYIDWGDGGATHEYTTSTELDEASHNWLESTPVTIPYHDFKGVYTEPNGGGELVFGASGNIVAEKLVNNTIYYAYWAPRKITLEFMIDEGDIREGCTFLNGTTVQHRTFLPNESLAVAFPEIISEMPVLSWKVGSTQVSDGNVWNPKYRKISDLPFEEAKDGILTLTPTFQHYNCFLTLDWGNRREEIEIPYGSYAGWYMDQGETFAGMELIGWARDRNETSEFVNEAERIYEDTTIYAIWKYYRPVTFHNVTEKQLDGFGAIPTENDKVVKKHIYQFTSHYLPTPVREGFTFLGWYDNPDFRGEPVSRILTYDGEEASFYAKWAVSGYDISVRYFKNYSPTIENFYVGLDMNGGYRLDLSKLQPQDENELLIGLTLFGELEFDAEGRWLGKNPINITASANYELLTAPKRYVIDVNFTDPFTGDYGQTLSLIAELTEGGVYRIVDTDRMPSGRCATVAGYYMKSGKKLIKVFDGDGVFVIEDAEPYARYYALEAIYSMADVEVRYEIPEGFKVAGETEYTPVYTVATYYSNSFSSFAPPETVSASGDGGAIVGWYHEYLNAAGETVRTEPTVINDAQTTVLYDEEKKVYYVVMKAEVSTVTENGGDGAEGGATE